MRRCGAPPVTLVPRIWFNPAHESSQFLLPGLVAVNMTLIGTLLTALVIAREWERGTMEALMSTPIGIVELLVGKLAPYFVLGMAAMAFRWRGGRWSSACRSAAPSSCSPASRRCSSRACSLSVCSSRPWRAISSSRARWRSSSASCRPSCCRVSFSRSPACRSPSASSPMPAVALFRPEPADAVPRRRYGAVLVPNVAAMAAIATVLLRLRRASPACGSTERCRGGSAFLIVKELFALWRDPRSRVILVVPPIVQLLVFAFAMTQEVTNVRMAVLNQDLGLAIARTGRALCRLALFRGGACLRGAAGDPRPRSTAPTPSWCSRSAPISRAISLRAGRPGAGASRRTPLQRGADRRGLCRTHRRRSSISIGALRTISRSRRACWSGDPGSTPI